MRIGLDKELVERSVERLFPPGSSAVWRSRDVAPNCRFWVIPGREGPRWIVPQDPRLGWPVVKQWRPYDPLSRGKWSLLMAAYRAGRLDLVPGVVPLGIAEAHAADWSVVGWNGDAAPVPVIYIGTPGPTRKVIATLVEQNSHEPTTVAKAPLGPRAAAGILREADVLGRLAVEKPGIAPRALFVDRTRGLTLQECVVGRLTGRSLTRAHVDWLTKLHTAGEETSLRIHVEQLRNRLTRIDAARGNAVELVERTLDLIADPMPLPAVWVHGDFAPWNLRWSGRGKLQAIDWERGYPLGLPMQDIFYFQYIQCYLFKEKTKFGAFLRQTENFWPCGKVPGNNHAIRKSLLLYHLAEGWVDQYEAGDHEHAEFTAKELARVVSDLL